MKFDLKQSIENVSKLRLPKKIKLMDHTNKVILSGIPLVLTSVPPDDQSPCIKETCGSCAQPMWVSEKKREHCANKPNVEIYCMTCVIASMCVQGFKIEDYQYIDFTKLV